VLLIPGSLPATKPEPLGDRLRELVIGSSFLVFRPTWIARFHTMRRLEKVLQKAITDPCQSSDSLSVEFEWILTEANV